MSWCGGMLIDGFYSNSLNGQPLVPDSVIAYAASPIYNDMSGLGTTVYYVNLFYALCYFCPIMGVVFLYQALVKYQSAEYYGSMFAAPSNTDTGRRRRRRRNR